VDYAKSSLLTACMIIGASIISYPVRAEDMPVTATIDAAQGPQLRAQSQATDNSPSPITLRIQYTGEAADNAVGGIHDGAAYMNQILAQLHINTDKAFGWRGGNFVLEGFYETAGSLDTRYVGAAQDPSVIDTSSAAMFRLYQAYYQQDIDNTNLLFGVYDLETEFGVTRPMDIFFNASYAWTTTLDQSGLNGPSTYPNTSLAIRIREKFNEQWSVQAAVLDGVPDSVKYPNTNPININKTAGALLIGEVDYVPTRTTKILAGYWDYTGEFSAFDQTKADDTQRQVFGSSGGYVGGATRLYSQTAKRGLDVFANIGFASSRTNQIDRSLSIGLTYTGLLDDLPFDRLGVAVGLARAGNPYKQMQIASGRGVETYETNFEVTYRARVTSWLTIQPDIQYWLNPNMDPALKNDLLFLIHFEVSHVFDF
jgi:porin